KKGVNLIYLGGTSPQRFGEHLRLAEKYGMKLIPQLDFAYFMPNWDENQVNYNAMRAGEFISKYGHYPQVIAWSVKEEVAAKDIYRLAEYYKKILLYAPDARFELSNNNVNAATNEPPPNPVIAGAPFYVFYWTECGDGYLASPAFSLRWARGQAAKYYEQAAVRRADFLFITTQGGMLMPEYANIYAKHPEKISYPQSESEKAKLRAKILTFAEEGRMGWKKITTDKGDFYNVWQYYRLPGNCMKAMAWIGVLEGAKMFLCWHYAPPTRDLLNASVRDITIEDKPQKGVTWWTLAGRPGKPNPQLDEFGEASKEIRSYERIITRMTKLAESVVQTKEQYIYNNAFSLPDVKGKVIVIQNSNVGTWPHNSRYIFKPSDMIYIDDEGNLVDYVPYKEPLAVHFSFVGANPDTQSGVFDIKSGKELLKKAGEYEVSILPGSGTLIFIGSSQEADILHKMAAAEN
ncbi:MAG: hypothetical protein WCE45_04365, partial [Sedimentisphaerales bacterium]